jgi:anti-sigma factor RsiW
VTGCGDIIDLLLEYLDGALDESTRSQFDEHLSGCGICRQAVDAYAETPGLCRKALSRTMPKALADNLTSFLRQHLEDEPH